MKNAPAIATATNNTRLLSRRVASPAATRTAPPGPLCSGLTRRARSADSHTNASRLPHAVPNGRPCGSTRPRGVARHVYGQRQTPTSNRGFRYAWVHLRSPFQVQTHSIREASDRGTWRVAARHWRGNQHLHWHSQGPRQQAVGQRLAWEAGNVRCLRILRRRAASQTDPSQHEGIRPGPGTPPRGRRCPRRDAPRDQGVP